MSHSKVRKFGSHSVYKPINEKQLSMKHNFHTTQIKQFHKFGRGLAQWA